MNSEENSTSSISEENKKELKQIVNEVMDEWNADINKTKELLESKVTEGFCPVGHEMEEELIILCNNQLKLRELVLETGIEASELLDMIEQEDIEK